MRLVEPRESEPPEMELESELESVLPSAYPLWMKCLSAKVSSFPKAAERSLYFAK